jgi:hypothetical protein
MAKKKETTMKKAAPKTSNKKINVVKEPEKVSEINVEVINGDPSVIAPVEEIKVELPKADEVAAGAVIDVVEETAVKAPAKEAKKAAKKTSKITMKLNQYFGYFWNGQAIDY